MSMSIKTLLHSFLFYHQIILILIKKVRFSFIKTIKAKLILLIPAPLHFELVESTLCTLKLIITMIATKKEFKKNTGDINNDDNDRRIGRERRRGK